MSKTVGILGGMGPAATVELMARMVRLSTGAAEQDGVRMLVDNNPHVPDRNKAIAGDGPSPAPVLAAMARGLELAGADFLVMACNTAHAFQDAITDAVRIPFLSMIDETVRAVTAMEGPPKTVAVLAASGCLDARIYQNAFAAHGIATIVPEGGTREEFMRLLYAIKRGDTGTETRHAMAALAERLISAGGTVLVAGCTEVPLVLSRDDVRVPLIDSTQVLARAAVAMAR